MKKYYAFLLSLVLILGACGNKYDKEIDSVVKKEKSDNKEDKYFNQFKKDKSNIYVYDDGNIIVLSYKSIKGSDTVTYDLYRKTQGNGKYEKDNDHVERFVKEHEPDYKEENMK
ncbi:cystatin-like fold lipoprotein [Staphylococcus caprae]|uniref:cystatin-like fold lipoprotein n=1 Tax=Staphylococcus caprae TaxID=29380 RepID=UPI001C831335|nr:cystatin-like fold lipoprotein [Staphylococcus caprae]MBX5319987.1 cystatin-like fold lipoprotein [Staphylococcus caprae]MDI9231936.1 cystatin-like fold lipoprotein [Staphylococcus caprae]